VITGGAVTTADGVVMTNFFKNLYHRSEIEHGRAWPKVCLLASIEDTDPINNFIDQDLSSDVRSHVTFINGSPLQKNGLQRALAHKARIIYILPCLSAEDMDAEDEANIQVALSVKSQTDTPFRLVLLRPSSLKLAVTCGIRRARCCTLNLMKTAILAQSCRVLGWGNIMNVLMTNVSCTSATRLWCEANGLCADYISGLENDIWGFCTSDACIGMQFGEFAQAFYEALGMIPLCVAIDGQVSVFPCDHILQEKQVVFCLGPGKPEEMDTSGSLVHKTCDWQKEFVHARMKADSADTDKTLVSDLISFNSDEDRATAEQLAAMQEKAQEIKTSGKAFALLIMTHTGKIWQQVHSFTRNFCSREGMRLIVMLGESPPKSLVDALTAHDRATPMTFVLGDWSDDQVLKDVGVPQCSVISSGLRTAPTTKPESDQHTFFLVKSIAKVVHLNPDCVPVIELSSGTIGAHMLPKVAELYDKEKLEEAESSQSAVRSTVEETILNKIEEQKAAALDKMQSAENSHWALGGLSDGSPKILEPDGMEDVFYSWVASGNAFVPHSMIGMLAKTFYTTGLLEVMQALTVGAATHEHQAEQVKLPMHLRKSKYSFAVTSMLTASIGPCPALPIGLLRFSRSSGSQRVMAHPQPNTMLVPSDILIVLANAKWIEWAKTEGLYCIAGQLRTC
jgi:hypothetical protein